MEHTESAFPCERQQEDLQRPQSRCQSCDGCLFFGVLMKAVLSAPIWKPLHTSVCSNYSVLVITKTVLVITKTVLVITKKGKRDFVIPNYLVITNDPFCVNVVITGSL